MLSREGFEVQSAVGFSAAVDACKNGKFDLVIMGHSIPTADQTFSQTIESAFRCSYPGPAQAP